MSQVISNLTEQKPPKHKSVHSDAIDVINGKIIMVQVFKTMLVNFCHYTPITMMYIHNHATSSSSLSTTQVIQQPIISAL